MEKHIVFSQHALDQLSDRGTIKKEVEKAILEGERLSAKKGRVAYRKNFPFEARWKGHYYSSKQVMPIVVEEDKRYIVITVYVFFIGESK